MKIPRKFSIKGNLWQVKMKKKCSINGAFGVTIPEKQLIEIKTGLTKDHRTKVFLHELCHAWLHEAHVTKLEHLNSGLDEIIEEIICDNFADILTELFEINFKAKL